MYVHQNKWVKDHWSREELEETKEKVFKIVKSHLLTFMCIMYVCVEQ